MAYTDIDKPSDYFETVLYTGNGGTQSITSLDFQPDWLWIKDRDATYKHLLVDAVRGATKHLSTVNTAAEITNSDNVTAFNSDGFSLSSDNNVNRNTENYVAWNWKAGGGAGSSNEDGSINTTSTSVNQTAGFSISTWTGTGSNATVGHGLGAVPKMIITKARSNTYDWYTYHASIGNTKNVYLNLTNAESGASTSFHNNTNPTSSVWTAGGGVYNVDYTFVTYAFAEKKGYSKFGSYTGNGNADGTFVYTGFKPAFLMIKGSNGTDNWQLFDSARSPQNDANMELLYPNLSNAEDNGDQIDLISNGFKARKSTTAYNSSGSTFIYMAFAENPFVTSTGVPATAR
jgi:hypothetical protein